MMRSDKLNQILQELKAREPIFHRREFGTSRAALLEMTIDDFWEVGASGKTYFRESAIEILLERYKSPKPHDWPCDEFAIHELGPDNYLLTYILTEPDRRTRRSTIWRNVAGVWKIVYHQGTIM
jgi:hypothetical protein